MAGINTVEVPIEGMDCVECTRHVQRAIESLPGVESVEVFLASEKAVVRMDTKQVDLKSIGYAVANAGYSVRSSSDHGSPVTGLRDLHRPILTLLGIVFGAVLFIVVVGEWLGLFGALTERVPLPMGIVLVLATGFPVLKNVIRATLRGQVIAHTLMTLGAIAALAVGQWATAAVVVFFMRVGDYTERFTAERARRAVKDLTSLAPRMARIELDGDEEEVPVPEVMVGDIVVVRPGEMIPVDGKVISGQATVDQAVITGESMPVEVGPGSRVFATTMATLGSLRISATHVGPDTTFGRVIKLVEEAEAHQADVQRLADRFSGYYLPFVAGIAALTYLIRMDALATAAVLIVACSCSIALATPIAMLASIGAGAKRGLLIKGGKYLELLARADVFLIDKTGTLTLGKPEITDIVCIGLEDGDDCQSDIAAQENKIIGLAASAERFSEHPLAEAVRAAANVRGITYYDVEEFQAIPGYGVRARINGNIVSVGGRRLLDPDEGWLETWGLDGDLSFIEKLEAQGKTLLFVLEDGRLLAALAAADTLRPEVPRAIQELRASGVQHIELLTGDNKRVAESLASKLGVAYQAELLPEDKIRIVEEYKEKGYTVVMVGDGVNDAPALARSDVGIAMEAVGSNIAIEAAHIALMRQDWLLVPEALRIARRTMGVVKGNLAFTAVYNLAGLTLAAMGFIPPILAAVAQSIPDLGILVNSSRLLKASSWKRS